VGFLGGRYRISSPNVSVPSQVGWATLLPTTLGQFVDKLGYKLGSHGIKLVVTNESYTSKASFVEGDKMPKRYNYKAKKKHSFSGKRIKRGLYKSGDGTFLNADTNGAYNILRKTDSDFSFSALAEKVGTSIKEWLHPTKRFRFLNEKTHQKSNFKRRKKVNSIRISPILDQQFNLF